MNHNLFKHIVEKKEKRNICANHPVSVWKDGYKRCYWGFKLGQICEPLEQDKEEDGNIQISTSKTKHVQLIEKGGE